MTVPDLTFLLDDGTGTFPHDISTYVRSADGYSFSRGRADWQGGVTAGQLSITLNNLDGRFTAGSTIISSPSPIVVDQQVRLIETVGGTDFVRGTWYVKSWPVTWPATVSTFAVVALTAVDAQARAERRILQSMPTEEVLLNDLTFYFPFNEPNGSKSVGDASGSGFVLKMVGPGSTDVTFGVTQGMATTAETVADFDSNNLRWLLAEAPFTYGGSGYTAWFMTLKTTAVSGVILAGLDGTTVLSLDGSGSLVLSDHGTPRIISDAPVNDGEWHTVWVSNDWLAGSPGIVTMVIDGVSQGSAAGSVGTGSWRVQLGFGFTGSIGHFCLAGSSAAIADNLSEAFMTGYNDEPGTDRLGRLAGYVGLPVGTFDDSLTNVPFADFTGSAAQDVMQQVTDAEGGALYINGDGEQTFHNRAHSPSKTAPDLTLSASFVTPDVQPVVDDQQLVNYFETSAVTGVPQVVRDAASEATHGRYSGSADYLVSTDVEALDRATWIVAAYAEPTIRYGTLTINLYKMDPSLAALVLAAVDVDCWLRLTDMAPQNPDGCTVDVVVEGFSESGTGESWVITCNVVSRSLFTALILDDPVFGALDDYPLFY